MNVESPNARETAVYGKQSGQTLAQYYVPAAGSSVETLVKTTANLH